MDNQRLMIWGLFGVLAWITYQTWVSDFAPKPVAVEPGQTETLSAPAEETELPALAAPAAGELDAPALAEEAAAEQPDAAPTVKTVTVTTDVYSTRSPRTGPTNLLNC